MTSIKSRINGLERSSKVTVHREWTDAERAIRLFHILNHPVSSPAHASLPKILKRVWQLLGNAEIE